MRVALVLSLSLLVPFAASADASPRARAVPGKIVFSADGPGSIDLWVVRANGEGRRRLTRRQGSDFEPRWSPSGRRVAFLGHGPHVPDAPRGEIYVVNADGSALRRLTRNQAGDSSPTWSPDGRKILYVRHAAQALGTSDLFVAPSAGGRSRRLTRTPACEWDPDWSPDGKRIVVALRCGGRLDGRIAVLKADGSGTRVITPTRGYGPVWSPDGHRIAFISDSIRLVNPDGTSERRVLDDADTSTLSWSPDGSMLAFTKLVTTTCPEGEVSVHLIYVVSIRGGRPRPVSRVACNGGDHSPDWHR